MAQYKQKMAIWLFLFLSLFLMASALATPTVPKWILSSGGGESCSGNSCLFSVTGQWVVGRSMTGDTTLSAGFLESGPIDSIYTVYLPLVLSNSSSP